MSESATVIVPAWNGRELLPACLDALLGQQGRGSVEIVVVDNASTDGSAALVAERYPKVCLESYYGHKTTNCTIIIFMI